jgi:hypothetical protein
VPKREIAAPAGNRTLVLQPIASHFTDSVVYTYLTLSLAPQPSLGLGLLCNLLPLKMVEFLGGFSTIFFFTG